MNKLLQTLKQFTRTAYVALQHGENYIENTMVPNDFVAEQQMQLRSNSWPEAETDEPLADIGVLRTAGLVPGAVDVGLRY